MTMLSLLLPHHSKSSSSSKKLSRCSKQPLQQQQKQMCCSSSQLEGKSSCNAAQSLLHSLLPACVSAMSLDKLCKEARTVEIVKQRKDVKQKEAGKLGDDTKRKRGSKAASRGSTSE
uniref:Uncharacterized protein n=1 Tax=Tetradesmus obliquus TaxID=3088 RepID=A0A383V5R3_TETOB